MEWNARILQANPRGNKMTSRLSMNPFCIADFLHSLGFCWLIQSSGEKVLLIFRQQQRELSSVRKCIGEKVPLFLHIQTFEHMNALEVDVLYCDMCHVVTYVICIILLYLSLLTHHLAFSYVRTDGFARLFMPREREWRPRGCWYSGRGRKWYSASEWCRYQVNSLSSRGHPRGLFSLSTYL